MKVHPLLIALLCLARLAPAQKYIEPDKIKTFNIVVNYDDYTVKAQMLKDDKKVKIIDDRTYMWCSANKIIETKAGYDGKLLHGYYKSFYFQNNQLRESGTVSYGLKTGEWRSWYADGNLREVTTYHKGKKNGKYYLYNDEGKLMARGSFKDDLLHGNFYTYNVQGGVIDKKKYSHGSEVIKAPKPAKVKKVKAVDEPKAAEPKAKQEKKKKEPKAGSEAKPKKQPAEKNKKAPKQKKQEQQRPAPAKQKTTLGQKIKNLFKKKDKQPATAETKPVSSSV